MQKLMMQQLQLHKCPLMGHPDHRRHHHRRRHHQRVKGPAMIYTSQRLVSQPAPIHLVGTLKTVLTAKYTQVC